MKKQPELFAPDKETLFKYAICRKNNKRIIMAVYICQDEDIRIVIETKRLVGDWKDRNIMATTTCYGIETIQVFFSLFDILFKDLDFKKKANRQIGQMLKDKFKVDTNIKFKS